MGIKIRIKKTFSFLLKHKKKSIAAAILVIIIIFIFRPKAPSPITTQTVKQGSFIQSISVSGKVDAAESADLTFQLSGKLVYLGIKKGDKVSADQTIGVLDQRITLKNLQNTLIDYSKQRNTFDSTKTTYQNRTPEEALSDSMKIILQNNQYDLNKAIISVELQDLARQQSILTSPISGIVTRADVQTAGVTVGPATTFSVVNPNTLVFKVDVDQADIAKINPGQTIKVNLDAYPNDNISLVLDKIDFSTHITSTGGNAYAVSANLPTNNKFNYKIGMEGNAEIITAKKENVLSIPLSSVTEDNHVFVKSKSGFEKKKVSLGIQNDTDVIVEKGLSSGNEVVLDPSLVPQKKQGKFLGLF